MRKQRGGKSETLRGGAVSMLAGTLAQGGFRFALNVLIGRFGGPSLLGQTAGILATAQLATLLGATSLSAALTRYLAASAGPESAAPAAVLAHLSRRLLQWLLLVPVGALGIAGATGVLTAEAAFICFVVASSLAGYQFSKAYLLGTRRIRKASALEIVTAAGGITLTIVLLWLGVRDENLLWPIAATATAFVALSGMARSDGKTAKELTREIDRFALLGVAGTLVSAGFLQGSMIVASMGLGGAEAGGYASAYTLATPLSLLTMSVGLVLYPAFARTSMESHAFSALLVRATSSMAVLLVPLFCVIMFMSPEVIAVVWAHDLTEADVVLAMLACAVMLSGLGMPASQALTSTGVHGMATSVKVGSVGLAVGLLTWAFAVPPLGAQGVALGFLAGTAITSAGPMVIVCRRVGAPWVPVLVKGWGVGLGVAAMAAVAAHADVGLAARAGLTSVVVIGWLLHERRQVMVLLRR